MIAPHDSSDMGFGARPAPAGPPVALLLVSIAVVAAALAAASGRIDLLWPPLALVGLVQFLLGSHRLRTDDWRERDWWTDHRRSAVFLVGLSALRAPRHERRAALIQVAVGVLAVGAAVLLIVL